MKRKIILLSIIVLILIAAVTGLILYLNRDTTPVHEEFAKQYVECFMKDNPAEQYKLLDIPQIRFGQQPEIDYQRSPLPEKHYSIRITNTREASESVLKKINNVYSSYCKSQGSLDFFEVDRAYRYNVKIKNKGKQIYNVSFWVVEKNKELSVCTIYEYERSLDRCFVAGMY